MEAIGFLIGEPEKDHLKRNSTQELLMKWGIVKMPKNNKNIKMDVDVHIENKSSGTSNSKNSYTEINESEEIPYKDLSKDEDNEDHK
ncbi:hypothetical protein D3C71_1014800 [compost metagenome]